MAANYKFFGIVFIGFGAFMAAVSALAFALAGLSPGFYAISAGLFLFFGSFGVLCMYMFGGKQVLDERAADARERREERREEREAERNAGKCSYCGRPVGRDDPEHCPWCGAKLR